MMLFVVSHVSGTGWICLDATNYIRQGRIVASCADTNEVLAVFTPSTTTCQYYAYMKLMHKPTIQTLLLAVACKHAYQMIL